MKRNRLVTLVPTLLLAAGLSLPALGSHNAVCNGDVLNEKSALAPADMVAWAESHGFSDFDPSHWAAPAMVGVVTGGNLWVPDGVPLNLDAPAMLYQAGSALLSLTGQLPEGLTPREATLLAAEKGLIPFPIPDEDRPITRLEAALIAAALLGFPGDVEPAVDLEQVFADAEAIPPEARGAVYWVSVENRLFIGHDTRRFAPHELFTVGQFAQVLERLVAFWAEPVPDLVGG